MHRTLCELAHECNRHEIKESVHESSHAKLRNAVLALTVLNRFLCDTFESRPLREYGNVAMHFAVNLNTLHHLVSVGLESAVEVVQFYSGNSSCYSIETFRGKVFGACVVVAFLLPSTHEIIAFGYNNASQFGEFIATILQVGIHGDNNLAFRSAKAFVESRGFAVVALEFYAFNVWILFSQRFDHFP